METTSFKPLITDPEVLAIPIEDEHEALVDVKNTAEISFGPVPETLKSAPFYTKVRASVFDKLTQAQALLPKGVFIRLYEGLRHIDVQKHLFDELYSQNQSQCPEMEHELLFLQTTKLCSPVINLDGSQNIPPHCTGAAVDVELIDENGNVLDMGMEAKDWLHHPAYISQTDCVDINEIAQKNRKLLLDVMIEVGFVNYYTEWWHYSFGDRYWAFLKGKSAAKYGLCYLATK